MTSGFSGRCPTVWQNTPATTRCGARSISFREAAADAVAHVEELADAEMVHQPELVVGEGVPRVVDRDRAGRIAAVGVALVHGDGRVIMRPIVKCLERLEVCFAQ